VCGPQSRHGDGDKPAGRSKVLSGAVASGVIVLVVIKHLGLLGPFYSLLRRRSRQLKSGDVAAGPA
jgi:hypothetical protein